MSNVPKVTVHVDISNPNWDQAILEHQKQMSDYINKIYQDILDSGGSYYYGSFTIEPNCPCQDHNKPEFESHSLFCDTVRKNEFWAVNRN
jgi:hypothetical protein